MTISNSANKVTHEGNGILQTFAYNFKVFDDDDIEVYLIDSDGNETLQSDYTVTGVGEDTGGNVVFGVVIPSATEDVLIRRVVDILQETDYIPGDPFHAETHEDALDYQIMVDQQLNEEIGRSVKAPVGETGDLVELPSASDRASRYFIFDTNGAPDVSATTVDLLTDHGYLDGLADDDHTQYILVSGTRPFLGTVGGITPVADADLATKGYVDTADAGNAADIATNASGIATNAADIATNAADIAANTALIVTTSGTYQAHADDATIHFTEASISHAAIVDDEPTKHRLINDGSTSATELWSGYYIDQQLTTSGVIDHGALIGLGDNDHPQYAIAADTAAALALKYDKAGGQITGDVTIIGNLTVSGTEFISNVETLEVTDNLILLNAGETGAGVTLGEAGVEIDRGSETNYRFMFDEVHDHFEVGVSGTEQAVATREDTPTDTYVPYWNAAAYRFDTAGSSPYSYIEDGKKAHTAMADAEEPTGFINRTDSTLHFDESTRTVTISGTYSFYEDGVKYTKTDESIVISADTGIHGIYYEVGTLTDTLTVTEPIVRTKPLVAYVYWDDTISGSIYFADERHGITMDGATHSYLHFTVGTQWLSGLPLNTMDVDGSGNDASAAQFGVDSGAIVDEDIYHVIAAQSWPANLPVYYQEGASGTWKRTTPNDYPVIPDVGGRLAYNEFTGGVWQQTEISNNDFVLCHVFATNDIDYPVVSIQGQNDYGTINQARTGAGDEIATLVTAGMPFEEFTPIATIIYQTGNGYSNAVKARVRSTDTGDDYVDWRFTNIQPSAGSVNDHGALSGLTDDDHLQYSRADGTRAFSSTVAGVTPVADADLTTKGYVDDEITTLSGSLQAELDTITGAGETGQYAIPDATDSFTVTFATAFAGISYDVVGTILNTTDANPAKYGYTITSTTMSGFNIELSDQTDSANYKFNWRAGDVYSTGEGLQADYAVFQERSASSQGQAVGTADAWVDLDLSYTVISGVAMTLSNDVITVSPGTYRIKADTKFTNGGDHVRLYDDTNNAELIRGMGFNLSTGNNIMLLEGYFTAATEIDIKLQAYSIGDNSWFVGTGSLSDTGVYTHIQVTMEKIL